MWFSLVSGQVLGTLASSGPCPAIQFALNGSDYPQDPPRSVAGASRELPNAVAATVPGQGHTVGNLGCMPGITGRWPKVVATVGPGPIVMLDVFLQVAPEVAVVHDQKPAQRLVASGRDNTQRSAIELA